MKLSSCKKLTLRPITATWYRAMATKYLKTPLQTSQSLKVTSRFSPGKAAKTPFEIFYLAETPDIALREVGAILGLPDEPVANPHRRKTITFDVQVTLQSVADLSDPTQQKLLGTSLQGLTGNWDTYPPGKAPTQQLGAALFATPKIEGFMAVSAKMPKCRTLIVFPQKLIHGSELTFKDTTRKRNKIHRIPPSQP
jgi:hypothetical protein